MTSHARFTASQEFLSDAVDMATVLHRIMAAGGSSALLISTANPQLFDCQPTDEEFRETLLRSDRTADGTPIVWIARLLGLPIHQRIAGSDIFDALKTAQNPVHHLKVHFVRWRRWRCGRSSSESIPKTAG